MASSLYGQGNVFRYQRVNQNTKKIKNSWQCAQKVNPDIERIRHEHESSAFFRRLSLIFFFDRRSPKHNELSKLSQLSCFLRPTEMRNLCVLHQNRQVSGDTLKKARFSFICENTAAVRETRALQTS